MFPDHKSHMLAMSYWKISQFDKHVHSMSNLCELVYCGDIFDGQLHGNNDSQLRGVLCGDVCGQRWQSDRLQELYIRMCSWIIFGGKLHGQRHGGV